MKKQLLLISLLVALSLTGCTTEIEISPSPGSFLSNEQMVNDRIVPTDVLLLDVNIRKGFSNEAKYSAAWPSIPPSVTVSAGKRVWVVSGSIRNDNPANTYIVIDAIGYDATGNQVAWLLHSDPFDYTLIHLTTAESIEFRLELNFTEQLRTVRLRGFNYDSPPSPTRP